MHHVRRDQPCARREQPRRAWPSGAREINYPVPALCDISNGSRETRAISIYIYRERERERERKREREREREMRACVQVRRLDFKCIHALDYKRMHASERSYV